MYFSISIFHFWSKLSFTWVGWVFKQKCFQNRINPAHTNLNIPSNLFWAQIWCILLEERSKCTLISFTSITELTSSSPFELLSGWMRMTSLTSLSSPPTAPACLQVSTPRRLKLGHQGQIEMWFSHQYSSSTEGEFLSILILAELCRSSLLKCFREGFLHHVINSHGKGTFNLFQYKW